MKTYIDMHMHSTYSDGTNTVKEILEKLEEKGIGIFSITDHDNMEWILEMKNIRTNLEWYPGIDVSTIYESYKIHLLGYGFDSENLKLKELLNWIKNQRILRFYNMVTKAEEVFEITIDRNIWVNHFFYGIDSFFVKKTKKIYKKISIDY